MLFLFGHVAAGFSRDAILGRSLFELLQPAAPSVAPSRREQLQAEAQAGARFVLHGQVGRGTGMSLCRTCFDWNGGGAEAAVLSQMHAAGPVAVSGVRYVV